MKRLISFFVFLIAGLSSFAQQDDISFVIDKIKIDYPAYLEKTRGIDFGKFTSDAIQRNTNDTFKAMATITSFFKDRHLDLVEVRQTIDTQLCKKNLSLCTAYFSSTKKVNKYEGYWVNESRGDIICIRQVKSDPLTYEGHIVKCWPGGVAFPGMLLFRMEQVRDRYFFAKLTTLRTGVTSYVNAEFRNDSVLTTGPYFKWRRMKVTSFEQLADPAKPQDTATGKWLNPKTFLITIPTSTSANGQIVASIIKAIPTLSTACEHLIIDVRTNTGGTVAAYDSLYPLFYTNPIIDVSSMLYATKDLSISKQKELNDYMASGGANVSYINSLRYWAKINQDSAGKFVSYHDDTIKFNRVLTYPQKVSIIVNFGCQSACEMFLLNARQSTKVRLFGEHTMGAIDHLNFYPQITPSGKYKLYIPTLRRNIPPGGSKLDGKGIEPDVLISDATPDWVDFVNHYYEKH